MEEEIRECLAEGVADGHEGVVFLVGALQHTPPEAQRTLGVAARRVAKQDGVWLVASLTPEEGAPLREDSWVCREFACSIRFGGDCTADEVQTVARSILDQHGIGVECDTPTSEYLRSVVVQGRGYHEVRRVLETLLPRLSRGEVRLAPEVLLEALATDAAWLGRQIRFRGETLARDRILDWVGQFPEALQPTAWALVRNLTERYFIGDRLYFELLGKVSRDSGIAAGATVHFCEWQQLGESAKRVAQQMKTVARWKVGREIDLRTMQLNWLRKASVEHIVLADDLVGSGRTIEKVGARLVEVLTAAERATAYVLPLLAFESGLRAFQREIEGFGERIRIRPGRLLSDADRVFDERSRLVPDVVSRQALREFLVGQGGQRMSGLSKEYWLGFGDTSAFVAFFDAVPNNSLAALWYTSTQWKALLPR